MDFIDSCVLKNIVTHIINFLYYFDSVIKYLKGQLITKDYFSIKHKDKSYKNHIFEYLSKFILLKSSFKSEFKS